MQTVNFQCGHCGKLMAVGVEHVGQQVRCPHCQQVVLAPAGPAPPPEPAPSPFGDLNRGEDIFSVPSETEDVLFGGADAPRLELPRPEATVSFPPAGPDLEPINGQPTEQPTFGYSPPTEAPREEPFESPPTWTAAGHDTAAPPQPDDTGVTHEPAGFAPTPRVRRPESGGLVSPMFLLLVFLPVLLWAIGATGIGYWLYSETLRAKHLGTDPFEAMPDGDGDNPGIKNKQKAQLRRRLPINKAFATRAVPEGLQVNLEEALTVGDLRVTPQKVIRQKVEVFVEGSERPEPCLYSSLVLYMKLENLSDTYSFSPIDNYFDRYYSGADNVPLTLLQAGKKTFIGGPCQWLPRLRSVEKWKPREWLNLPGRKNYDPKGVPPGESMQACVCTDGGEKGEPIARYLFGETGQQDEKKQAPYKGGLLWHVHLRRGPYRHKGRTLSATCVIGVKFDDSQIQR